MAGAPEQVSQEEMREAYLRVEQLRQQVGMLEGQRDLVTDLMQDATRALTTIEALATQKEGDEILVPLGTGTFIHARLASPDAVITALGAGVHAETNAAEAQRRMKERLENLQKTRERLGADLQRLTTEMNQLGAALEAQGA